MFKYARKAWSMPGKQSPKASPFCGYKIQKVPNILRWNNI